MQKSANLTTLGPSQPARATGQPIGSL